MEHRTWTVLPRHRWLALSLACLLVGSALLGGFRLQVARADETGATGRRVEELGVPIRFAPGAPGDFPDAEGHWGSPYIRRALARGFVNGYPDGRFHPNREITRAEFIRIVAMAWGLIKGAAHASSPTPIPTGAPPLTDTAGHWAAPYIDAALSAGVLREDDCSDGRFQPDRAATRLEMVVWLIRALGKEEQAGSAENRESARRYRDHSDISRMDCADT